MGSWTSLRGKGGDGNCEKKCERFHGEKLRDDEWNESVVGGGNQQY